MYYIEPATSIRHRVLTTWDLIVSAIDTLAGRSR